MKVFRLAAVGTDKARLKVRAIAMQARGTEVGPSLLGTAASDNMTIDSMNSELAARVENANADTASFFITTAFEVPLTTLTRWGHSTPWLTLSAIHDRGTGLNCFAEPVIGRRFASTRWLHPRYAGVILEFAGLARR